MAQIKQMTRTESGTYDVGCDMVPELGLRDAEVDDVLDSLQDTEPDEGWRAANEFRGWGLVLRNRNDKLLSVTDEC